MALSIAVPAAAQDVRWTLEESPAVEVEEVSGVRSLEGAGVTEDGRLMVLVELVEPSAAEVYARAMAGAPADDRAARRTAGNLSRTQVERNRASQDVVGRQIATRIGGARELYRVDKVLNGIAVAVPRNRVDDLASIPGVRRVLPIALEQPTNSTSVPFIGAPQVWANTIGRPFGADGSGVRIGVIDTGIDYLHPAFGGPGATATDCQTERTDTATYTTVGTATGGSFPTAKVVGGWDFAGDAYTGFNAPAPDANPMDCGGHGSHVAGSAAAFGMNSDGTTFTGPYDANPATYSSLAIGPGTAPQALLYGLRVFGCYGSTGLAVDAIDWAMDPNGDNDLSDHLDVINMSLGSSFGSVLSATAVAADAAAAAGVIVVTSAGNSGDTFFISGSPGSGSRVIATASSVDDAVGIPAITVTAPPAIAGGYLAGYATFGPQSFDVTSTAVLSAPTEACSALTNPAAIAGNVCVVDRGTCGFTTKAANCQAAGAVAVIVVDNAPGSPPPGMGGTDPTIVIPAVRMTLADGTLLKNNLPATVRLATEPGGDTMSSFSSRGPRRILGSPLRLKPDIAAPGQNITSVQTGTTCPTQTSGSFSCTGVADATGIQVGSRSLTISGTSMASPHMAGVMALLRQLHPDWTVEELKALAMNYATNDLTLLPGGVAPRFGPARVGAGRVDPPLAAGGDVIAMNADDVGVVSVTFEQEVVGVVTRDKTVRILNKGIAPQTFTLGFDDVVDSPGVAFSLPNGNSVTVGAGQAAEVVVRMTADASQMDHTRDASLFPSQAVQVNYGDQPRNFLTEEGSYLTFSQGATLKFRLPVYMAQRPSSDMSAPAFIATGGAATGSTDIPLIGTGVCTGTLSGSSCTGTFPNDVASLVTPLELQVVSPLDPINAWDFDDIQYAGVSYLPNANGLGAGINNDLVIFGVSSWGDWSTLNEVTYAICVDNNQDGTYDRILWNMNPSVFVAGASATDNFVRAIRNTASTSNSILGLGSFVNLVGPNVIDSSLHLNNVMLLAATPSQLGFASTADTDFRYRVVTCGGNSNCAASAPATACTPAPGTYYDIAPGPYYYDWAAPGLDFGGNFLADDQNGALLPVTWNTANMTTNGSLGALLLHHHNGAGKRAEVVLLEGAQSANLSIAKSVDLPAPSVGQDVVFTLTVGNVGPDAASGVVVSDYLPNGLTYVSDDGGGAYDPVTGLWTVGAVAMNATATLNITATVDVTGQICNMAEITAGTPLDPSPADNRVTTCINSPRSADLVLAVNASPATVNVGAPIHYTMTITNTGVDTAYGVNLGQVFAPVAVNAFQNVVASHGVYSAGTWSIASLPVGATATLEFDITAPNMAGVLTNTVSTASTARQAARIAVVHANAVDPVPGDNTQVASVTVLSAANVGATKTAALVGTTATYTVVLTNTSGFDQQDNPGDEFTDVLPAELTLISASATAGTAVATAATNTVTWNGVVPANGSVTITIVAHVISSPTSVTVSNQGTVSFDLDGNGTNEASGVTDDPAVGGAADPTVFTAVGITEIPTLDVLGLVLLAGVLALAGLVVARRRRNA